MIDISKLSGIERQEYDVVQASYRRGDGFSNDVLRFERYFHYIKQFGKMGSDSSVLDVGCGPGPLEVYLDKYGFKHVEAMDFSDEGINICKKNVPHFSYVVGDANKIENIYAGKQFDVVFCCQVLEHLPGHKNVLKQLYNLTKEEGMLIISVPWDKCKTNHRHVNNYLPETFKKIAQEIGISKPIITERFGDCDLQLLVIFIKEA